MAELNDKPSLASFTLAVNNDLKTNPNAQKVAQHANETLSPTGSFTTYKYNREDAIRYDDPELGYLPFRNNENLYGEYQSTAEKWGNGLTKFVGKTSTNVVGNLLGTVYGAVNAIANWDVDKMFDNDFFAALDQADTNMDREFANYYTDAEKNAGLASRFFSANTWADKVLGGASFVAGAVISEAIASAATAATFGGAGVAQVGLTARILDKSRKLFKAADKVNDALSAERIAARGLVRGVDDAIAVAENAAKKAPKIGEYVEDAAALSSETLANKAKTVGLSNAINRVGTFARQQLHGTLFEAGVEAMHHGKELRDEMIRKYEEQYGQTIDAEQLATIDELVDSSQLSTFATNAALLTATNMAQFKEFSYGIRDLMAIGKKSGSKIATKDIIEETTEEGLKKFVPGFEKWSKFRNIADKTWTYTKNPIMEGVVEEGLQGVINNTFHEYNLHKYNPNGLTATMDLSTAFGEALGKQYGTVDGWEENMIGMILGGVGVPMARRVKNEDGTSNWKFEMSGGIATDIREKKAEKQDIQNRANFLQKTYDAFVTQDENGNKKFDQAKFMSSIVTNAVETASIAQQRDGFVEAGDFKRAKDADSDMAFSFFKARYDTGRFQDSVDDMVNGIESMSVDDFRNAFGYDSTVSDTELEKRKQDTIKSFTTQSENVKKSLRETDQLIPGADENLRAGVAHAIFRNRNAEDRIQRISQEISYLTNNSVTPNELSKSLTNQFTLNNFLNPDVNFVESPDFKNNYITSPDITPAQKEEVKKEYERGIELISKITQLEEEYNKPAPSGLTEEGLTNWLNNKTKTENELIAAKEEYLKIGQKYLPSFRTIKDVNDVRLNEMIGNTKATLELNEKIDNYVKEGNTNQIMVADLQRDLNKLLADKLTFARLYNYLLTKRGQEEFQSIDKSIKNSLTQDYLKLISKYNILNNKLGLTEQTASVNQLMEIQKRISERFQQEKQNTPPELFNDTEVLDRITKEEEQTFKNYLLAESYNEEFLDKGEEDKTISYAGRLVTKGNAVNLASFLDQSSKKDTTKPEDPKTPEDLNKEIAKENEEIQNLSTETGIDLKPLQSLNRAFKNTENILREYKKEEAPSNDVKTKLKESLQILKDELETVQELFDKLSENEDKPLDTKVAKKFKEILNKAEGLVSKVETALKEKTKKAKDDDEGVEDSGVVTEYPDYFQNLYRGSVDSPIEGVDYNVNRETLKDAWTNDKLVVRKRKLDKPVNAGTPNANIVRVQEFSYDVIIKNEDGTESFVGVLSTPNSFKFKKSNGALIDVDYSNDIHVKAFNPEFVDEVNTKTEDGEIFSKQAIVIQEWEDQNLEELEEGEEISTDVLKKVFNEFGRRTTQQYGANEDKPTFKNTEFFKNFDEHAIQISSINVKPRYQEGEDYTTLNNIKGMYYIDDKIVILVTKDADGKLVEYNFQNADIIKNKIFGIDQLIENDTNLPWINLEASVKDLRAKGVSRFIIAKPFGGDMIPVALTSPAFTKDINLTDAFKQLSETEDITSFEFNKDDQNKNLTTGVELGNGYKGAIIPSKEDRGNRPFGVTINLTETRKEFASAALVEDGTIDTDKPVGAFVPLVPKNGNLINRIAIGVEFYLRKEYRKDNNEPFYKLRMLTKENINGKDVSTEIEFNINLTDRGLKIALPGKKSMVVNTLQEFLQGLHLNPTLLASLSSDKTFQDLIKNYNIGYNPKLKQTILRKKASDVGENFSAMNAGGKVYFKVNDALINKKKVNKKDPKKESNQKPSSNTRKVNRKPDSNETQVSNTFDQFFEQGVNELKDLALDLLESPAFKTQFNKDSKVKTGSNGENVTSEVDVTLIKFIKELGKEVSNSDNQIIKDLYNAVLTPSTKITDKQLEDSIMFTIINFTDFIDKLSDLNLPDNVITSLEKLIGRGVADKATVTKTKENIIKRAASKGFTFEASKEQKGKGKGKGGKKVTEEPVKEEGPVIEEDKSAEGQKYKNKRELFSTPAVNMDVTGEGNEKDTTKPPQGSPSQSEREVDFNIKDLGKITYSGKTITISFDNIQISENTAAKARLAFTREIKKMRNDRIDLAIPSDELEKIKKMESFQKKTKDLLDDKIFAMNEQALNKLKTDGVVVSICPF